MTIDPMTAATRFFNVPLLIDPAKGAAIAQAFGPRLLGLEGGSLEIAGGSFEVGTRETKPRAGSFLDDGTHRRVKAFGGYSIVNGVAVIPVVGSLVRRGAWLGQSSGMTSYEGISAQIRAAAEDPEVVSIALEIDSFGGEAHGAFALANEIREVGQVKPVRAFLAEYALSAGYMIAAQAEHITVSPFGEAGSIGVVTMHVDRSVELSQAGIKVTFIHAGAHKVEGNQAEPLPDSYRDELQASVDQMWVEFADVVGAGRGTRLTAKQALETEARCFEGQDAVDAGLADEVAEARAAFEDYVAGVAAGAANAARARAAARGGPRFAARGAVAAGTDHTALGEFGAEAVFPVLAHGPSAIQALRDTTLIVRAEAPITGPQAQSMKETDDMSKDVDQPKAPASDAKVTVTSETTTEAPEPNEPQAADAAWVMTKCDKAGLGLKAAQDMVAAKLTREQVLEKIIDLKADDAKDGGDIRSAGAAAVSCDARDRAKTGMTLALLAKAGLDGGERNEFSSMSLREMARHSLQLQGLTPMGGTMEFAGMVFAPAMAAGGGMHSTSDFANILVNVANKSMLKGFTEAPEVFEQFTSIGTLSDFKPTQRVGLDEFPVLDKVAEGAEFQFGSMGDHAEMVVLATYGKLFALTRQTIINDDLAAFTRIPQKMGRAARRTIGDLVFAVLSGNPLMGDGTALFHANHKNLAVSGGAPSEASINAGITAMATQTDRSEEAKALNIAPRFLIAPPSQRSAVLQSLNSEHSPDDTAKAGTVKQPRAYNTVRDAAEPIFDARLTGNAWYLSADPAVHDGIEVSYLDGNPMPFLEQQEGWSVDGTEFKVRIDAAAKALAYQTLYKDPGQA